MMSYANLHFTLERLRQQAEESQGKGPIVLILGAAGAGKSTLAKLLAGYAIRQGRSPITVGLDPKQVHRIIDYVLTKQSILSVPGTLTAASLSSTLDVEEGYGSSTIHGQSQIPTKTPLVYYYGHQSPTENPALYRKYMSRLALAVTSKMDDNIPGTVS